MIPTRKELAIDTLRLLGLLATSVTLFLIVLPLIFTVLLLWPLSKLFDILTSLTPWCMDDTPLGYGGRFIRSLKATVFYKKWLRNISK